MRTITHLFSAHSSLIREQRLVCFTEPEKTELPKTDAAESLDKADALAPANVSPEAPSLDLLKKTENEKAERAAKLKAAQDAIKKTEAEQPADAANVDIRDFYKKWEASRSATTRANMNLNRHIDQTVNDPFKDQKPADALQAVATEQLRQNIVQAAGSELTLVKAKIDDIKRKPEQDRTTSEELRLPELQDRQLQLELMQKINPGRMEAKAESQKQEKDTLNNKDDEFRAALDDLLAQAKQNSTYPLPEKLRQFVEDFAKPNADNTQDSRNKIDAPFAKDTRDIAETHQKAANASAAKELGRIKLGYPFWRGTAFEPLFRDRVTHLMGDSSQRYSEDKARISDEKKNDTTVMREFLDYYDLQMGNKPGTSSKRFNDPKNPRDPGYGDLSDYQRQKFAEYKVYNQGPTLTQYEFDKKYFNAERYGAPEAKTNLTPAYEIALNNAAQALAPAIQSQPAVTKVAQETPSASAEAIVSALNDAITRVPEDQREGGKQEFVTAFLQNLKRIAPERVKSVSGMSFSILDDDKKGHWYNIDDSGDGYSIANGDPAIQYSDSEIEHGLPAVEDLYLKYAAANNKPLPNAVTVTESNADFADTGRVFRASEANRQETLRAGVEFFNAVNKFERDNGGKLPSDLQRKRNSLMIDLGIKFGYDDITVKTMVSEMNKDVTRKGVERGIVDVPGNALLNKPQVVASYENPEQKPSAEVAATRKNGPLNIRPPNIGPTTLNRPRNAVLDGEEGGFIKDIDAPSASPTRNRRGDNRNRFQPKLTDAEIKQQAEDYVNMPKEDGTELTDAERAERKLNAAERFGVNVNDDGSVYLPNTPEKVQENKNRAAEQKLQKDYDKTSDANKSKKETELMMQYGASIENGKVVIPKDVTALLMNRVGGFAMKAMEFFAKLGEMWNKAFGKATGAPATAPASTPEKKLDKAGFDAEAALLKKASEAAKADPAAYKSALEKEKGVLELPAHKDFLDAAHNNRLKIIINELKHLDATKNGVEVRSKVEAILKGKLARTWNKDPSSEFQYKKLGTDSFIRKASDGMVFFLMKDGSWMQAKVAANIYDQNEAKKYEQMLDLVGKNGDDFVQIPNGDSNFLYGHLTDDPKSMIARTQETDTNGTKRTVMYRYYPPYRGWEKF